MRYMLFCICYEFREIQYHGRDYPAQKWFLLHLMHQEVKAFGVYGAMHIWYSVYKLNYKYSIHPE
jgi:hypothetical protein